MALIFTKGSIETMVAEIRLTGATIESEVERAVLLSTHEGADSMQDIIIHSETDTGRRRAEEGHGAPGRIDTGDMFNDVKSSVENQGGGVIVGKFGWPVPQDYYGIQDNTDYSISGTMHALLQSWVKARENLIGRLAQIARNGKLDS